MLVDMYSPKFEQASHEALAVDLEGLGATANNRAFLENPDDGVHYNVFVDAWRWAKRHFERKRGDTHRKREDFGDAPSR